VYIFKRDGLLLTWSAESAMGLGWNLIGILTITVWTGGMCFVMFAILKYFKMLRVETEHEFKGMDLLKHGESAYPADAWVEQQYMKEGQDDTPPQSVRNGNVLDFNIPPSFQQPLLKKPAVSNKPRMSITEASALPARLGVVTVTASTK